jgi:hypothetical protein
MGERRGERERQKGEVSPSLQTCSALPGSLRSKLRKELRRPKGPEQFFRYPLCGWPAPRNAPHPRAARGLSPSGKGSVSMRQGLSPHGREPVPPRLGPVPVRQGSVPVRQGACPRLAGVCPPMARVYPRTARGCPHGGGACPPRLGAVPTAEGPVPMRRRCLSPLGRGLSLHGWGSVPTWTGVCLHGGGGLSPRKGPVPAWPGACLPRKGR